MLVKPHAGISQLLNEKEERDKSQSNEKGCQIAIQKRERIGSLDS